MTEHDKSPYKKAYSILNRAVNGSSDSEKQSGINLFKSNWNGPEELKFADFLTWLKDECSNIGRPEDLRPFLESAAAILAETMEELSQEILNHFAQEDSQAEQAATGNILNDICALYYQADQMRKDNQHGTAKLLETEAQKMMTEHGIQKEDFYAYRAERRKALISLFEKADILGALTNQAMKERHEAEFAALAAQYGFVTPDGSSTTDEFNTEYTIYLVDRDLYKKGGTTQKKAAQDKTTGKAQASSSEEDQPQDEMPLEEDEELSASPAAPVQTELKIFPIRNLEGDIAGITTADSYGEALNQFFGVPADEIGAQIDFPAEKLVIKGKKVKLSQHADIDGLEVEADELELLAGNTDANVTGARISTKRSSIRINDLRYSNVTLSGEMVCAMTEHAEISLLANSKLVMTNEAYALSLSMEKGSSASFAASLRGGRIKGKNNIIAFENENVTAEDVTFEGVMPSSPALKIPEKEAKKQKPRNTAADKLYSIEALLQSAFDLGIPGRKLTTAQYSKWMQSPKTKILTSIEAQIIKDTLVAILDGYPGQSLSFNTITEKAAAMEQMDFILKKCRMMVIPLFPNQNDANKKASSSDKIKGKFHYRIVLVPDRENDVLYQTDCNMFNENCDPKTGYPKEYFADLVKSKGIMFDVTCNGPVPLNLPVTQKDAVITKISAETQAALSVVTSWEEAITKDPKKNMPFGAIRHNRINDERENSLYHYSIEIYSRKSDFEQAYNFFVQHDHSSLQPVLLNSSVFSKCEFSSAKVNFVSDNMSGNRFSAVTGQASVTGDMKEMAFRDKCEIAFTVENETDFSRSTVASSTLSFGRDSASSSLISFLFGQKKAKKENVLLSLADAEFTNAVITIALGSGDTVCLNNIKASKTRIEITGDLALLDLSGAQLEDCEINVSGASSVKLEGSVQHKTKMNLAVQDVDATGANIKDKSKIKIKGKQGAIDFNAAQFSESEIKVEDSRSVNLQETVQHNTKMDVSVEETNATGAVLTGTGTILGRSAKTDFTDATLGTRINHGPEQIMFKLKSTETVLNGASLGNIEIADDVTMDTEHTNWGSVSIAGNIKASVATARSLYPLFGRAANLAHETPAHQSAGNKSHPARSFHL